MSVLAGAYHHIFRPFFAFSEQRRHETAQALRAARIPLFPEWYLTLCYLSASAVALLMIGATTAVLATQGDRSAWLRGGVALGAGLATFFAVRLAFLVYPRVAASGRGRAIEAEFPSVAMVCYALARGGMSSPAVFRVIAEERDTYGEISREFDLVIKNIEDLGEDMNSALLSVAATTPSPTLKIYFEGLVTILNSGADPRDYYKRKAEGQLEEADLRLGKEVEQAGLLAESYVSGLLVLPLLLIVVLSVLSVLGSVQTFFIPIIIFLVVPGGTLAYLVLVDMLLPPESVGVAPMRASPGGDIGLDTLSPKLTRLPRPGPVTKAEVAQALAREVAAGGPEAARAERLLSMLTLTWMGWRVRNVWLALKDRSLTQPLSILAISAPAGLLVFGAGAYWLYGINAAGSALLILGTGVILGALLVVFIPVSLFHEMRLRKARLTEGALPETLSKLAGFNERGVPLLRSFQILGRSTKGPLADEFRALDRDVSWSANLTGALARMRERATTRKLRKVGILFERGVAATGNLKEVLEIAAKESATSESQVTRKRQAMMSYTVVVYVVFAVFLYVIYTVTTLFYGDSGFSTMGGDGKLTSSGIGKGIPAQTAHAMYVAAVLIQGACCGLVAGKLGEGRVLSGLKHAAIMCVLGWTVFYFGLLA